MNSATRQLAGWFVIAVPCVILALSAVLLCGAAQDQTIRKGASEWTMVQGNPLPIEQVREPDQTLQTTIQDPRHEDEPWVVTTYRRDGESELAFVKRHGEMVDAVRAHLE
jgi:hypothetical protein